MIRKLISTIKILLYNVRMLVMTSNEYCNYLRKRGVKIGNNVNFRYPVHTLIDLTRPSLVEIGNNVDINDNFTMLTHDFGTFALRGKFGDFINSSGGGRIGDNVVIGRDVTMLKGSEIGNNSVVALGSVITKPMPDNSVIAGIPARVICSLDEYYKKRKNKQIEEALEYGCSIIERFGRQPRIEDFTEEWVLFLTKQEYEGNENIRKQVDFRLKGYADISQFLEKAKPYHGFAEFLEVINRRAEGQQTNN